jgi:hypothetical protein
MRKTVKIEVRNVKFSAFASEETNCFEATLYIDGKRGGAARNAGHGGATYIEPRECEMRLNAHAATLPRIVTDTPDETDPSGFLTYAQTGESLVDDLVEAALVEREVKKALRKRILYTRPGKVGIFQTRPLNVAALARALTNAALPQTLDAETILNVLPLADAIALYKNGTRGSAR